MEMRPLCMLWPISMQSIRTIGFELGMKDMTKRVFDNRYLISRVIDVYIYGSEEQYGSLQPGLSIPPEALKIYQVNGNELIPL